ncbi:Uncharacterised protein [Vibrio cholerae]|nr:Uncharacterised protein [Vibrio cholerae]
MCKQPSKASHQLDWREIKWPLAQTELVLHGLPKG